jgi:hypothetical protein
MKKKAFIFVLSVILPFFAKGQANFQEFINDFPLMNGNFTWTGADLEKARTSGKKVAGAKLFFITDGESAWGEYFPVARIEVGGTIFAFWAYHTGTYDEGNTQIHLCSRAYNKKGKVIGITQNYMASNGGVPNKFQYSFEAVFDSNKKTLLIDQKSTDKPMERKQIYLLSSKGFSLKN